MSDNDTFFTKGYGEGFGAYSDRDELLHPELCAQVEHYSATETQYLGFNVPEEGISCMNYMWHHARLGSLTGGSYAWQGHKGAAIAAELFDMRQFMDTSAIKNDLTDYTLDTGYRARVVDPFRELHISYKDDARRNAFDVTLKAVAPPAMIVSGKHFEQAMHATGELLLRGKRHAVNSYVMRDRTWAEARPEIVMPIPHTTWMNGIFSDDFSFNVNAADHPDLDPIWRAHFNLPPERTLMGGWVWVDGELRTIASAKKKTTYDTKTLTPKSIEMRFRDSKGREYEATGVAVNSLPMAFWMNMRGPCFLMRWEIDGKVGYGECQDVQWTDFVHACMGR